MPKKRARSRSETDIAAYIEEHRDVIIPSVISSGLGLVRSSSAPERLLREANRFVTLIIKGLRIRDNGDLRSAIVAEVRTGALAGAKSRDLKPFFDVWRRTFFSCTLGFNASERDRLDSTFARFEDGMTAELRRWSRERTELVVIGASVGGLRAIGQILSQLTLDFPASIVAVQHLSQDAPSVAAAVLARRSRIATAHVIDRAFLTIGCAYIAPPARHVVVRDSHLRLIDTAPVNLVKPAADVLFRSAAEAYDGHAASVVLTGNGKDGSAGTEAIHDQGGVTFAQHPGTAEAPSMPQQTIATGKADFIVKLDEIAPSLQLLAAEGREALSRVGTGEQMRLP